MASSAANVAVAITGLASRAPLGTAAPTTQATALNVAFVDIGFIGEDGITQSMPGSGDATTIKAWQNGSVVRTVRSASEDLPTFSFTMLETKKESLETYFGASVSQTATEGSLVYNSINSRTHYAWVLDYVDGAELERIYIPDGLVVEVGDRVWANAEASSFEVTIEAQYASALTGNFKLWTTRAHT